MFFTRLGRPAIRSLPMSGQPSAPFFAQPPICIVEIYVELNFIHSDGNRKTIYVLAGYVA